MLATFQGSAIAQPQGNIIGVEEELRGSVVPGCPDLLGRVDLLLESPEAVTIVDLKTSRSSRWSAEQVDDQAEQLLLYSDWSAGSCRQVTAIAVRRHHQDQGTERRAARSGLLRRACGANAAVPASHLGCHRE